MDNLKLNHEMRTRKYHVVFIPKGRRKALFGPARQTARYSKRWRSTREPALLGTVI